MPAAPSTSMTPRMVTSMSEPGKAVAFAWDPKLPTVHPGQIPSAVSEMMACACCTARISACMRQNTLAPMAMLVHTGTGARGLKGAVHCIIPAVCKLAH